MYEPRPFALDRASRLALSTLLGVLILAQPALAAPAKRGAAKAATPARAASAPKVKGIFEPVNLKEDLELEDVFFITPDLGYVSGSSGSIYRTTDGGATWTAQLGGDPRSAERPIEMLRFFDDRHGWAVQHDKFLRTTDGENWEEIGRTLEGLRDYVFVSEVTGFALGGLYGYPKFIYKTVNAGKTWKQVAELKAKVEVEGLTKEAEVWGQSIHFPNETTGYVGGGLPMCGGCGGPPLIAKTEDGGETWTVTLGPGDPKTSTIVRVFFTDEANGFAVLQEKKVFATNDGGQTWRGLIGSPGKDLQFADPEVAWSFTDRSTLTYTIDGGRRWSSRTIHFPADTRAMSVPRRDRVYVAGRHGMVYAYRIVPLDYEVPNMLEAPLVPGYDTEIDEEAEALATEVAALEEEVASEGESTPDAGDEVTESADEESDDGEGVDDVDVVDAGDGGGGGDDEEGAGAVVASQGATSAGGTATAWSPQRHATRLQKIQATLAALTADVPRFEGKLRNLNLVFFGLRVLNDLTDHGVAAQTALAAFRASRDSRTAQAALVELATATRALVTTTRGAFRSRPATP